MGLIESIGKALESERLKAANGAAPLEREIAAYKQRCREYDRRRANYLARARTSRSRQEQDYWRKKADQVLDSANSDMHGLAERF